MLDPRDGFQNRRGDLFVSGRSPAQPLPAIASSGDAEKAPSAQISASSSQLITDNNV